MGSVRWILGAVLVLAAGCLAPDSAPAPAADAAVVCGPRGAACPALPDYAISCERGVCVARAPPDDEYADCVGEGRYGVDLRHDPRHCGACGAVCPAENVCVGGTCTPCGPAERRCSDACVDTATDRAHCGACDRACAAEARCVAGACVGCRAGLSRCSDVCVDLSSDVANCGACGVACPPGVRCRGGACNNCDPGFRACDGSCVDLSSDEANCGACGRECPSEVQCADGLCATCARGLTLCGRACVDVQTDDRNCGECGRVCGFGCAAGRCTDCPSGQRRCDGACVSTATSAQHCGACGHACASEEHCDEGVCATCPVGSARCGYPYCIDLLSADTHCGACGVVCPAGQRCAGGRCEVPCTATTQLSHSDAHCGACGAACAAGTICIEARCTAVAPRPKAPISATRVTSARPWFRWELPADADGARVEVCATRDCSRVEARWDATGDRLRAPTALAPGVHFWRLYTRRGARMEAAPSIVWEFFVPATFTLPAEGAATVRGIPLMDDFNGDGLADRITSVCAIAPRCHEVHFSSPVGGVAPPVRRFLVPAAGSTETSLTSYGLHDATSAGDLNGDGFGDLLLEISWIYYEFAAVRDTGDILQLFAGGVTGLSARFRVLASQLEDDHGPAGQDVVPVGDRNGDGYGDAAIWYGDWLMPSFEVRLGGRGTAGGYDYVTSHLPSTDLLLVGDFDADGRSDIVSRSTTTPSYVIFRPGATRAGRDWGGPPVVAGCGSPTESREPVRGVVVDTNDDGFDDLHAVWGSGATAVHVLFVGGPDGLSPTRCTRLP